MQLYEKRKLAALEVEQLVKQLAAGGNVQRISDVIDTLVNTFATSSLVGAASKARVLGSWVLPGMRDSPRHNPARSTPPWLVPACSPMRARAGCCA